MFYIYELRDASGVPFYVGKGSGRRFFEHEIKARAGKQSHVCCKIRKLWSLGQKIQKVKVFETDNEQAAFAEEKRLIAYYGRDNLTNMTDGGDGPSNPTAEVREKIAAGRRGLVASEATRNRQRLAKLGTHRSEETKAKIARYQKGRKHPWAVAPHMRPGGNPATFLGRKHTAETIAKMRAAKLGHVVSEETRKKISETKKRKNKDKANVTHS